MIVLNDGVERFVARALDAASNETYGLLREAAESVRDDASRAWYDPKNGGVTRRTGKSGDIRVVTEIGADTVKVSVGSTDLAKAKFVHRPGRLATEPEEISEADYQAAKRKGGIAAKLVFRARRDDREDGVVAGKTYRKVSDPDASDGKFLLPELVTKPGRARLRDLGPELARRIVRTTGGA